MTDLNGTASNRQFTDAQKEEFTAALEVFMRRLCMAAPALEGHFNSGGVFQLATMSGLSLKLGFGARHGGILLPNGIRPATPPPRRTGD